MESVESWFSFVGFVMLWKCFILFYFEGGWKGGGRALANNYCFVRECCRMRRKALGDIGVAVGIRACIEIERNE